MFFRLESATGEPYKIDFSRIRKDLFAFGVDKKNNRVVAASFFVCPLAGTEAKKRAERAASQMDPEEAMRIAQTEVLQQELNELQAKMVQKEKKKKKKKSKKTTVG